MIKKAKATSKVDVEEQSDTATKKAKPSLDHTRSLTLKLDPNRYFRLNKAKYELAMSGQDILTEALDMWMAKQKY